MPLPSVTVLAKTLLCAVLAAAAALAPAQEEGKTRENMYLSGTEVRPQGPITGDLVAAAGRITLDHYVQGDAVLAAGNIELRSGIGEDLRAAGAIITAAGRIAGELLIGGWSVSFSPDAEVGGSAWIAGHDTAVAGRFKRGLTVYSRDILVFAEVDGDVRLVGKTIEVHPAARIKGKLTYKSSSEIKVHPGAQIGAIVREPGTFPRFELIGGGPPFRPLLMLGLLACGALLLALFPRFTIASSEAVGARPLQSLGLGTAIFFSVPPVILLLVITIIGIPIALAAAALYAVVLLAGYLVAACFMGSALLRLARGPAALRYWVRVAALAVALVALWLVRHVPYVGGLVILLVLIVGVGAMALHAFTRYSGERASVIGDS